MKVIENHKGEDFSDLFLTVKTVCLTEMELFELHAIQLNEFIKIKISHFTGTGQIAKCNQRKYGQENAIKYGKVLKELLENK